ncbi:MAG: hypothetical protein PHV02_03210 [Rhodocyclaceae bacterium]|nr:hypothetical protein [Rhodocyclaceae bacterium]
MSEVFERVIAEQQKQIDHLLAREKSNIASLQREFAMTDKLTEAAFSVIDFPDRKECRDHLRAVLVEMGFCLTCEQRICHCEDHDY